MILLFDPDPPLLRWCKVEQGSFSEDECEFGTDWPNVILRKSGDLKTLEGLGYVLYNGGEEIERPISLVTEGSLGKVERALSLLPESNDMTLKVAQHWVARFPGIPHVLLCDSAFFVSLPPQASTYAVPYELRQKGIRRYGGYGLYHQWAWEQVQPSITGSAGRVISIFLGDHTNTAAIQKGQPVETSLGFSSVEGIVSSHGCGEIDPTVISQLSSAGMSLEEINEVLTRESGFTALLGKECSLQDIVDNWEASDMSRVRAVFFYSIKKHIGALIATLGGVDAIAFLTDRLRNPERLILEICQMLEFLGLRCKYNLAETDGSRDLAANGSRIKAFWLRINKLHMIAEKVQSLITKEA
jgi:acetate kinase